MISLLRMIPQGYCRLRIIESCVRGRSVHELFQEVARRRDEIRMRTREELLWMLRLWRLWRLLLPCVRRQSCLYRSLLTYAHEVGRNHPIEVNVVMSLSGGKARSIGHMWLTRNGVPIGPPGRDTDGSRGRVLLAQRNAVRFWIEQPAQQSTSQGTGLFA